MRTRAPAASSGAANKDASKSNEAAQREKASQIIKENDKVAQENCKIYKRNLSTLQNSARIREKDDKGNYRYLTDKEKEQRMMAAEKYIKENCK